MLFSSRIYQITTKIENAMNNIQVNDLLSSEQKNNFINELNDIELKLSNITEINSENNTLLLNIINDIDTKFNSLTENNHDTKDEHMEIDQIILKEMKDELFNKVNILLNKNPDWDEYLSPILEKLSESNVSIEYIKDKLNTINELNEDDNYREQFSNLCLYLKYEIENENIKLDESKLIQLNDIINQGIQLLDNNLDDTDWLNEINNLNSFCEELYLS